jgi:hypothetical protein
MEREILLAQFSQNNNAAMKKYERFIKGLRGQGHRENLSDLKDQRFPGEEE